MDTRHTVLAKLHLELFKGRIIALKDELERAKKEGQKLDSLLAYWRERHISMDEESQNNMQQLEGRYRREIEETHRQNELAREMLDKKEEERCSLLGILNQLNFCDRIDKDTKAIDWTSLKDSALKRLKSGKLDAQKQKAQVLSSLIQQSRADLDELTSFKVELSDLQTKFRVKMEDFKDSIKQGDAMKSDQEQRINKMQQDSERLKLLIKQCAATNEPISAFVTKNVQAKCHSFLDSKSVDDLRCGLLKFKERQEQMIKILRHKESRLVRDCNLLKVAADQTADHTQYYTNLLNTIDSSCGIDW